VLLEDLAYYLVFHTEPLRFNQLAVTAEIGDNARSAATDIMFGGLSMTTLRESFIQAQLRNAASVLTGRCLSAMPPPALSRRHWACRQ
jgi:hypothetical protein